MAALVLALQLAVLVVGVSSADAHPYGPLQLADVAADGDNVVVTWRFGATDDISYLAAALEALPPERILLDGVILYQDGDEDLLTKSPKFAEYLNQHMVVSRGGEACASQVRPTADLIEDGVPVAFACSNASGPFAVTIDMLFDLHPAYRTLATTADGQRGEYVAEDATHDFTFEVGASAANDEIKWAAVTVAGGVALVALLFGIWCARSGGEVLRRRLNCRQPG